MSFVTITTTICFALGALVVVLLSCLLYQTRDLNTHRRQVNADQFRALERAEEARRVAENANRLKDEFLATASHELRTPLNAILSWAHVLQSGALPDGQHQHALDAIERNARIQARLIANLLDVSASEFVAALPVAPASEAADVRKPRSASAVSGVRVLLAEDNADSAAALTAILNLRGCEARTAHTAAECLRIIKEWPADVLLCDVGLPDDDGYSLLRRIRALPQGSRVPAIALTALARTEDRARALAAGFRAHVSKPFEVERLMSEIVSAVESAH